jgi:hypothetical protein
MATDDTAEMPIYREMEATWFGSGHSSPVSGAAPVATDPGGWNDPATSAPSQWGGTTVSAPTMTSPPMPPAQTRGSWQTAADEGWRAARTAAEAPVRTQTRTGLPKRVPRAQLVPGSVATENPPTEVQRSPDGVRGLLSAYHRGVQRGRGVDDSPVTG